MRGRTPETNQTPSPVEVYIDWKNGSDGYGFYTYSKEREEEYKFDFTKLMVIDEAYQTILRDNRTKKMLKSNIISKKKDDMEIDGIGTFNYGELPQGAKFLTLLTCVIDAQLCRVSLGKAASYQFLSVFKDGEGWLPYDTRDKNYIEVTGSEKQKTGNVEYEVPLFKLGGDINKEDGEIADKAADEFGAYVDSFTTKED